MTYRKVDQAMRRGQQWAEEQVKAGIAITPAPQRRPPLKPSNTSGSNTCS